MWRLADVELNPSSLELELFAIFSWIKQGAIAVALVGVIWVVNWTLQIAVDIIGE
jgi:hypothetical protein